MKNGGKRPTNDLSLDVCVLRPMSPMCKMLRLKFKMVAENGP